MSRVCSLIVEEVKDFIKAVLVALGLYKIRVRDRSSRTKTQDAII